MRKKYPRATVMCIASFEGVRKGDVATVELTPRILGILDSGYLRLVEDVPLEVGPGGDPGSEPGSGNPGTDDGIPAGDEPGEDPDAG